MVARQTTSPRDLEANLLSKAAANFQRIRDNWDEHQSELRGALRFNRRLWNVFVTSVTRPDSPLPRPISRFLIRSCVMGRGVVTFSISRAMALAS